MRFGPQSGGKVDPVRIHEEGAEKTYFASCRYFETSRWEFSGPVLAGSSSECFDLLIFAEGSGAIRWQSERVDFGPAQVWMIPAGLGAYQIAPDLPTSLLRTFVPREAGEFGSGLTQSGVSESAWSRLVHK